MIRLFASLLLSIGISVSAAQPCLARDLQVQVDSASQLPGSTITDPAAVPAQAPHLAIEPASQDIFSWQQLGLGTAVLLSPAALGFIPVDWALAAELIGQWF